MMKCGLEGNIQSGLGIVFFFFWISRVVLKTWVGGRVSFFVSSVLCGIGNIFLLNCPQVLSMLNVGLRDIFESHKSSV